MRRRGKLDGEAVGRARVWLPPRRECVVDVAGAAGVAGAGVAAGAAVGGADASSTTAIPRRWIGQVALH